ncbi:Accessory secretory protein Asp1 [Streptococcus sp. DD10]|uniref:accessory Sec system protein Asp1 n=1 Tax=Streptococcus sp. DD10 TaxID=1777878 RepID=UPI0007985163|nr:accessory Sec system protein Asp1 [Streptococcus sp. DD10]KXT77129.1 Accessory secretory protein Asp1 [Streptococcus sp. DD10]
MYYFIPAWYGNHRTWHADTTPWYRMSYHIEFDDTINQARIFKQTGTPASLVILNYAPQLRYFLHRQDLYEMENLSIFDQIQGISSEQEMNPLSLYDFEWSDSVDFIYTPFLIMVMRKGKHIANVDCGPDGNIISINYIKEGRNHLSYLIDDRGFISSVLYYKEGMLFCQEYLNPIGEWIIRENLSETNRTVFVNPDYTSHFSKNIYSSIDELIQEKFHQLVSDNFQPSDTVVVASSPIHNDLIFNESALISQKILSFYRDRHQVENHIDFKNYLEQVDLIVTDLKTTKEKLLELQIEAGHDKIHQISSFDSRLRLGFSQRKKESKIYCYIDVVKEIEPATIKAALTSITLNPLYELVFATYNASGSQIEQINNLIQQVIESNFDTNDLIYRSDVEESEEEELLEEGAPGEGEGQVMYRFQVKNFNNETEIIKELEYARLILDLNEEPDVYTQIAAISAGIPQINRVSSDYVEHCKNGWILSSLDEITEAVEYYLHTLKYWNESLVYSVQKIQENTGQRLIDKWEGWLKNS